MARLKALRIGGILLVQFLADDDAVTGFATNYQRDVVDDAERRRSTKAPKPVMYHLLGTIVSRQRASAVQAARDITDRIEDFPQLNRRLAPVPRRFWRGRLDLVSFFISRAKRIWLRVASKLGLAARACLGRVSILEALHSAPTQQFVNVR